MSPPTTKPGLGDGAQTQPPPEVSAPPQSDVEPLIRAVPMPDATTPGDEDPRPRWERASMPRNEWERALRSSDAAVARVQPGSPEFSRLMEVRVRLHFPPPSGVSLGDIDRYKQAQFEKVAGADLSRERARMAPRAPSWHRAVIIGVSACSVALVVYFVWALTAGHGARPGPRAASTAPTPTATATTTAEAPSPGPSVVVATSEPQPESSATVAATAAQAPTGRLPPTGARPPVPPQTAPPPTATATAKPTATGVKPYFD